jgi:hypothetical protein
MFQDIQGNYFYNQIMILLNHNYLTLIENMPFWLMLDLLPFKVDGQSVHLNNFVVNVLIFTTLNGPFYSMSCKLQKKSQCSLMLLKPKSVVANDQYLRLKVLILEL